MIDTYRSVHQTLLIALDGTEYFCSSAIHGPQCSTRTHANGHVTYSHTALTPVIVKPGVDPVIPLAPEFVCPPDGAAKPDCELHAAKRGLVTCGSDDRALGVTLLGDDWYAQEPFCQATLDQAMNFILVCKPTSHALTYEGLDFLERGGAVRTVVRQRWTGRRHEIDTYRYAHHLPGRDDDEALMVNGCEVTTTDKNGKIRYHNSFITHLALNDQQVVEVVAAGRCRWKIEHENNNPLKTKGDHFAHNYGHGQPSLASVLASLIILAFLVHTVLEWMDDHYRLLRQKLSSRRRLFNDLRALTSYLCFNSWDDWMTFMLRSFEPGRVVPVRLEPRSSCEPAPA